MKDALVKQEGGQNKKEQKKLKTVKQETKVGSKHTYTHTHAHTNGQIKSSKKEQEHKTKWRQVHGNREEIKEGRSKETEER